MKKLNMLAMLIAAAGLLLILPGSVHGLTLRSPTSLSVSISGENVGSVSAYGSAAGDFVRAQVKADFACPSGHIVKRLRMRTPYNWHEVDVSDTRATKLSNRVMPWSPIASIPELRRACVDGKSYIDIPVKLSAVCLHASKTSFADALVTPSKSVNIRVNLSCNSAVAPRYVPARAAAAKFVQDCGYAASGVEGTNQVARVTSSARPLQCTGSYNPSSPKLSHTKVYLSRHYCETGQVLNGFARKALKFDRMGAPPSASYGKVQWCHARIDPNPYLNEETTVQRGKVRVNLLGTQPSYSVTGDSKFRFKGTKAPAPPGKPVCKRADFRVLDEAHLMVITSGGDTSCASSTRTVTVPLREGAKNAARMKCINEAKRLKNQNKWSSLPAAGNGKKFNTTASFSMSLVGRYCYGGNTPQGSNWTYHVDCGEFEYQSEWNAVTSVAFDLECWSK